MIVHITPRGNAIVPQRFEDVNDPLVSDGRTLAFFSDGLPVVYEVRDIAGIALYEDAPTIGDPIRVPMR